MAFKEGDRVVHERWGAGVIVPKTRGTIDGVLCVLLDSTNRIRRVGTIYLTPEEKTVKTTIEKHLNLVEQIHGRARFEDITVDPPDDRSLTPQLDLPAQQWRDMGMPTYVRVTVEVAVQPQEPVNYTGGGGEEAEGDPAQYKDPAELFES